MAIFNSPDLAMQKPEHWGQYVPKLEDYRTTDEYNAALQEYQAWLASTPGGQPAGVAPQDYTGPGGEQWHAAGSQRMADQSQGNYDANLLNSRLQNASTNPTGATARMLQQSLMHRASIRPEETQGAYQAMNPDGSPVLAEPLLALYERLGIRPEQYLPGMNGKPIAMPPNGITPWTPPEGAKPPTPNMDVGLDGGDLTLRNDGPIRVGTPTFGNMETVGQTDATGDWGRSAPQAQQPSPQMTTFEQWLKNKYGGGGINLLSGEVSQFTPAGYGFQ